MPMTSSQIFRYVLLLVSSGTQAAPPPSSGNVCDYQCSPNGGCSVQYVGPPRRGKTSGSCFPDSFGGECSGTPAECLNCNQALSCGGDDPFVSALSPPGPWDPPQPNPGPTGSVCDYQCSGSGGCNVKYVGPPRAGKIAGSCFPDSVGGSCSGTPAECLNCNKAIHCQERGGRAIQPQSNLRPNPFKPKRTSKSFGQICDYQCSSNGGCKVNYVGPPRRGKISGSCSPGSFGGSCSGTPSECLDCNQAVKCHERGVSSTIPRARPSVTSHNNDLCEFNCKSNGGCTAKYVGPSRSGSLSGSCFSRSFGGKCSGIPHECGSTCHTFCDF